ncbi:MAG: DUF2157 domain-containing protein [Acidimicrobiales bacterium]
MTESPENMSGDQRRGPRRWVEPADQWRANVQRWVDAGIVSTEQGEEILALESVEGMERAHRDRSRPALAPVVEVASYVGVVAVGLATVLFLGNYWDRMGVAGHASVALLISVAGLVSGFVVAQLGDASARRVGSFLRLIGTAGVAMTTAVLVGPATVGRPGLTLLCVGVVVSALSAGLWRNRDRSLQFLSTLFGVALTLGAIDTVAHLHPTSSEVALFIWFAAIAVGLMSLQMLRPARTGIVVAEVGSFVGAFALSFPNHLGGVLLGMFSALCAVGIGFVLERPLIIVIGAVGFFMFDFRVFAEYLHSTNTALGAFILGLALIVVALLWARHTSTLERRARELDVDVAAQVEWYEPW